MNANIRQSAPPTAIVATTPDDSHSWNLVGVELRLAERGFVVDNLGPCTPEDLVAERIRDRRPDLVVFSSVNGHGALSLLPVLETLELYQVKRAAPIVAGGLLTTDPATLSQARSRLVEAGVAAVFSGSDAWTSFDAFLAARNMAIDGLRLTSLSPTAA